jgi:hypothetical protein
MIYLVRWVSLLYPLNFFLTQTVEFAYTCLSLKMRVRVMFWEGDGVSHALLTRSFISVNLI